MKLERIIRWDEVRRFCIDNELYTNGCNEEYNKLYEFIVERNNKINDDDLVIISEDILDHSITEFELIDIISGLNRRSFYQEA